MSIAVSAVVGEEEQVLFTSSMEAVPREDDVLEYDGKTYRVGPARWLVWRDRGGAVLSGVMVTVEEQ